MMLLLWLLLRSFLELIIAQAKVLKTDIWKQMLGKKIPGILHAIILHQ